MKTSAGVYQCPECPRTTTRPANLKRHIRMVHRRDTRRKLKDREILNEITELLKLRRTPREKKRERIVINEGSCVP